MKEYLPTKFEASVAKSFLSYHLHKVWDTDMTFDPLT